MKWSLLSSPIPLNLLLVLSLEIHKTVMEAVEVFGIQPKDSLGDQVVQMMEVVVFGIQRKNSLADQAIPIQTMKTVGTTKLKMQSDYD